MSDEPAVAEVDEPDAVAEVDEPDAVAEVDEPDAEAEVDEPDAEAEVDDGPSIEAVKRSLDREATRHEKALAKALGLPVEALHACPTCEGTGYTPEPVEAEVAPPFDPYLARCERCDGTGRVRTGARTSAMFELPCPGCTGQGYVQLPEQPTAGRSPANGDTVGVGAWQPPSVPEVDPDLVARLRAAGYTVVDPIVVPADAHA